jgi:hypothetical protein
MITSVFRKSTPINLILVVFLMLVFFLIYQFQDFSWTNSPFLIFKKVGLFFVLIASVFITDFITKRNGLSKDSSYTILFYFLFVLFFPSILNNTNLVLANFFVLLAIRRLISMQSLKASKEKIFDASLWIFIASLFHFWCIIFILLVFISIILHASRDYRNWILPFIAFFIVGIIFALYTTIFNESAIEYLNLNGVTNLKMDYFDNNFQNLALSMFTTVTLFFVGSMIITFPNRPLILHTSYKTIISFLFIGVLIFVISSNKSNDLLLFTFAPLSVMASAHIEMKQEKLKQEIALFVLIVCSLFAFFSQL